MYDGKVAAYHFWPEWWRGPLGVVAVKSAFWNFWNFVHQGLASIL